MDHIELRINGEPSQFPGPLSVAALLEHRGLLGKRVAVELNGEVVPRSRHADHLIVSGDRIEIVVAVGGG